MVPNAMLFQYDKSISQVQTGVEIMGGEQNGPAGFLLTLEDLFAALTTGLDVNGGLKEIFA